MRIVYKDPSVLEQLKRMVREAKRKEHQGMLVGHIQITPFEAEMLSHEEGIKDFHDRGFGYFDDVLVKVSED